MTVLPQLNRTAGMMEGNLTLLHTASKSVKLRMDSYVELEREFPIFVLSSLSIKKQAWEIIFNLK